MCQGAWTIDMPPARKPFQRPPIPIPLNQQQRRDAAAAAGYVYNSTFLRSPTKENAIFHDIRSILIILQVTGFLPIFEKAPNEEVRPPTKTHELYTFFIRGIVHACTLWYIYNLFMVKSPQMFYTYSDTDNVNLWIEAMLCVLTFTTTVVLCTKNSKQIIAIINDILKVDEEVRKQFGATLNNDSGFVLKFIVGIFLAQWYLIILKVMQVEGTLTVSSYILIGSYALQNALSSMFIVFASALLRIVTMRFVYVNLLLNGYTYVEQRKLNRRRYVRRVGNVAAMEAFPEDSLFSYRIHNKLLRIYKSINDCCSLILVFYMGYTFYSITTTTYSLFVQITSNNFLWLSALQWCFTWLTMHTALLALLSRSCGQATKEANTTSQILARVYGKNKEYQNIIDKFLTKSIKQEVQFTAYGFFVIDNSTLFKIFSAVTTYLVILIQFKQLEDSKMEDKVPMQD